ncbi:MAG: hypothetical protein M4579_001473 [Chaenotheca gracillima]|nr:MAG: hypothetical protein M4579_001473 [Chaenotheca gracillima]
MASSSSNLAGNPGQRQPSDAPPSRLTSVSRSTNESMRFRSDGEHPYPSARFIEQGILMSTVADSWVEISSQPSSSSLSSAATDEIVTTGLRVRERANQRRRHLLHRDLSYLRGLEPRPTSACSVESSQEEYEESESEDEQVLSSSSEHLDPSQGHDQNVESVPEEVDEEAGAEEEDDEDDDDDENATALGVLNEDRVFTPQPNAFSHPPSSYTSRQAGFNSSFPRQASEASSRRPSMSGRSGAQHSPYNAVYPSYQADHDAALRASLSTLLSCAAAARGLPKQNQPSRSRPAAGPSTVEPSTLRIVPESAILDTTEPSPSDINQRRGQRKNRLAKSRSSSDTSSGLSSEKASKGKRKAASSPLRNAAKDRAAKKTKRVAGEETISPTLLTWVVSAGVVVLVSALGFSAGYAIGKEAGRAEVGLGGAVTGNGSTNASSCGREAAARGLRRLRWSGSGAASVRV